MPFLIVHRDETSGVNSHLEETECDADNVVHQLMNLSVCAAQAQR